MVWRFIRWIFFTFDSTAILTLFEEEKEEEEQGACGFLIGGVAIIWVH